MKPYNMSPLSKRSSLTAFQAGGESPRDNSIPSSSLSLTSLPEEIIFNCLIRVPRCYYQNLCRVSKTLRSLVRSPELHRLRSLLPKDSVCVFFYVANPSLYRWFTLREIEKTTTKIEYRLVSSPFPFLNNHLPCQFSTVSVGSEIFFIGGSLEKPSSELWILDTRSGELTKGPNMKVARLFDEAVVEKIDGKVYVLGGSDDVEIQVEVFDPKSREWKVAESPKNKLQLRMMNRVNASLNGKVYMVEGGRIAVYDPRKGGRLEEVASPSNALYIWSMFVVDDVLYAYDSGQGGLLGFDARLKVWRRVVGLKTLDVDFYKAEMGEYNGMLAIFWYGSIKKEEISCALIALDWIGDVIRGKIEWYGIVATIPGLRMLDKFLVCSD